MIKFLKGKTASLPTMTPKDSMGQRCQHPSCSGNDLTVWLTESKTHSALSVNDPFLQTKRDKQQKKQK